MLDTKESKSHLLCNFFEDLSQSCPVKFFHLGTRKQVPLHPTLNVYCFVNSKLDSKFHELHPPQLGTFCRQLYVQSPLSHYHPSESEIAQTCISWSMDLQTTLESKEFESVLCQRNFDSIMTQKGSDNYKFPLVFVLVLRYQCTPNDNLTN